jgi:hypothetical protein
MMSKLITITALCALFCGTVLADTVVTIPDGFSGAFQTQTNNNEIANAVDLEHGDTASNIVGLQVGDNQSIQNTFHLQACQNLNAALAQDAEAMANSGIVVVAQDLGNSGAQWQLIGSGVASKAQGQQLGLSGTQSVTKSQGEASATALQTGLTQAGQTGSNDTGTLNEGSNVASMQYSSITGSPGTIAAVGSAVTSTTSQSQMVY